MSVSNAIRAIEEISSDLVVLPDTQAYDEITNSYFTELERELKPACFLTPKSAKEVAGIIKAIKPFTDGLKIAICGAGQQATPAVANVHDGLTIHLGNIRGVEVETKKKVVSIAAGEKMGHVYEIVTASGLGVAGNRHSSGGIGGDAVQGESHDLSKIHSNILKRSVIFSYDRGFVCDDVVNYELVLASGEVVNANAETNNDFWAALKGGGNQFGIVTRFDLRL
jgi:FAD/FMN-containing dehydrogenase